MEILKVLNHPNIVRYIDSEFQSRAIVIVMEYVTGGTLFDFIQRQKDEYIPEDKIISLFVQITVALSHIHSKNILHRDLKTQNLLIDRHHQVVKISDFGISKVLNSKVTLIFPAHFHKKLSQKHSPWWELHVIFPLKFATKAHTTKNQTYGHSDAYYTSSACSKEPSKLPLSLR